MTKILRSFILFALIFGSASIAQAQKFAVKTNLLGAVTLAPNIGIEFGLGKRTSLDAWGYYNGWNTDGSATDNKKLAHWVVQSEFRYWLCERFNGHFFGAHGVYAEYNVSQHTIPLMFDKKYRYEGNAYGGGISYGYHLVLSRKWGMEFTAGVGVLAMKYDKYDCPKCGTKLGTYNKTYFGPTRLGISIVYIIK